jgi:hypothetical protein
MALYSMHLAEEVFMHECMNAVPSVPCLIGFPMHNATSTRLKNESAPHTFYHVRTYKLIDGANFSYFFSVSPMEKLLVAKI